MADFCSISDIETYTGTTIIGGDDEALYSYLISGVSAWIETICNRKFNLDTYDEVYDIDGRSINLNQYPIDSITSISYGSPFRSDDRTAFATDEFTTQDDAGIVSLQFGFKRALQWINVIYDAGYDPIPDDLNLATVEEVVGQFKLTSIDTNKESEKLGDYSYRLRTTSDREEVLRSKLSKYIKYAGV